MNNLHFRGRCFYISNLGSVSFIVREPGLPLISLSRNDLRFLAMKKYGWTVCRAPGLDITDGVIRFMQISNGVKEAIPSGALAKFRAEYIKKPRRIPHVKLVKASSLLPGMSIARWLMADDEQPGRRHGRVLDIRTVTLLGGQTYLQCSYKNNPIESNSIAIPYSLWLAPQQLVPVLAGWRDKVRV